MSRRRNSSAGGILTAASGVFASFLMFCVALMLEPDGSVSIVGLRGRDSSDDLVGRANVRVSLLAFNQTTIPTRLAISRTLASGCKTLNTTSGFYTPGVQGNCSVCRTQCPIAGECPTVAERYTCGKKKVGKNNKLLSAEDEAGKAESNYSQSTSFMTDVADLFEMDEDEAMAKVMEERQNDEERVGIYDLDTGQFFPVAPREFMGITNWSKVPNDINTNQAILYIQGVFFPALIFVILAAVSLIGTLAFTIGRCPCCFCGRACCYLPCFPESCCVPFLKRPCVRRCCCAKPERRVIWFGFPMCLCPRNHPVMGEGHERGYIYNGGLQVHKDGRADDGYAPFMPDLIPKLPALDEHCTVMCQDRFRELIFDADEDANGEVNLTADKRAALMAELLSNLSDPDGCIDPGTALDTLKLALDDSYDEAKVRFEDSQDKYLCLTHPGAKRSCLPCLHGSQADLLDEDFFHQLHEEEEEDANKSATSRARDAEAEGEDEKRAQFQALFKLLDVDKSGLLDRVEIEMGLDIIYGPSGKTNGSDHDSLLNEIMSDFDANNQGVLSPDEFERLMFTVDRKNSVTAAAASAASAAVAGVAATAAQGFAVDDKAAKLKAKCVREMTTMVDLGRDIELLRRYKAIQRTFFKHKLTPEVILKHNEIMARIDSGKATKEEEKFMAREEKHWRTLVMNQEIPGCCGGKQPTVAPLQCPGSPRWFIEWCCCCDCCFGCCEMCNPCCRRNMFDYERKRGLEPGYSVLQSRLLQFAFVALFLASMVAYTVGLSGLRQLNCATRTLLPSLLDTSELMLLDMEPMMLALEMSVGAMTDIQLLIDPLNRGGLPNALETFHESPVHTSVSNAFKYKGQMCDVVDGAAQNLYTYILWMGFCMFVVFFPVLLIGCCGAFCPTTLPCGRWFHLKVESNWWWCCVCCGNDGFGNCHTGCLRVGLVMGTFSCVIVAGCAMVFLITRPLGTLIGDFLMVLINVETKGVLTGFGPGGPPSFCGLDGPSSTYTAATEGQMLSALSSLCLATQSLCQVKVPNPVQPTCCVPGSSNYGVCSKADVCVPGVSDGACCSGLQGDRTTAKCCLVHQKILTCPDGVGVDPMECTSGNVTQPDTGFVHLLEDLKGLKTIGNYLMGCPSGLFTFDEAASGKTGASAPRSSCNRQTWTNNQGEPGTCELKDFFVDGEFADRGTRKMIVDKVQGFPACGEDNSLMKTMQNSTCSGAYICLGSVGQSTDMGTLLGVSALNGNVISLSDVDVLSPDDPLRDYTLTLTRPLTANIIPTGTPGPPASHPCAVPASLGGPDDCGTCQTVYGCIRTDAQCQTEGANVRVLLTTDTTTDAMWKYVAEGGEHKCVLKFNANGDTTSAIKKGSILKGHAGILCVQKPNMDICYGTEEMLPFHTCKDVPTEVVNKNGTYPDGCYNPILSKSADIFSRTIDIAASAYEMLNIGFKANTTEGCQYPEYCHGGKAMRRVVDCEFMPGIARSMIGALIKFTIGLSAFSSSIGMYAGIYMGVFCVLIWGFKRWNQHYIEKDERTENLSDICCTSSSWWTALDAVEEELKLASEGKQELSTKWKHSKSLIKMSISFLSRAGKKVKKRSTCGKIKSEWARECRNMHAITLDPRKVRGVMCQINDDPEDDDDADNDPGTDRQRIDADMELVDSNQQK